MTNRPRLWVNDWPGPDADAVHFQPELAPLLLCGANHLRLRARAGPHSAAVVDTAAAEPEVEALSLKPADVEAEPGPGTG